MWLHWRNLFGDMLELCFENPRKGDLREHGVCLMSISVPSLEGDHRRKPMEGLVKPPVQRVVMTYSKCDVSE